MIAGWESGDRVREYTILPSSPNTAAFLTLKPTTPSAAFGSKYKALFPAGITVLRNNPSPMPECCQSNLLVRRLAANGQGAGDTNNSSGIIHDVTHAEEDNMEID
jgi:hypothetical protein